MMNKKVTAMVLASVLASPVMMAKISMAASGKGKSGPVTAAAVGTSTKTELEFEGKSCVPVSITPLAAASVGRLACAPGDGKAAAEFEFEQKTKDGSTKTKLSAEVELFFPLGATMPGISDIDIIITPAGGSSIACNFIDPQPIPTIVTLKNGTMVQKVEYHGSVSQTGGATPVEKGLHCDSVPASLAAGDGVEFDIGTVVVSGNLQPDN